MDMDRKKQVLEAQVIQTALKLGVNKAARLWGVKDREIYRMYANKVHGFCNGPTCYGLADILDDEGRKYCLKCEVQYGTWKDEVN